MSAVFSDIVDWAKVAKGSMSKKRKRRVERRFIEFRKY